MAQASNAQVQTCSDFDVRPACEATRGLKLRFDDILARFDDVYANVSDPNSTWLDQRPDHPAHLATPGDLLNFAAFAADVRDYIKGHAQWSIIEELCVKPVQV